MGQAWIELLEKILAEGTRMGDEGLEVLGAQVTFRNSETQDPVLARFADENMVREMEKVFFNAGSNSLGHSYAKVIHGPGGRHDLQDIIELLKKEPLTKRAVISFLSQPGGKTPCISAAQFLVRDEQLQLFYFARGQDIFKKFYADGHCLALMARKVAKSLGRDAGWVQGFIGSSHVYDKDLPEIRKLLEETRSIRSANPA